MKAISVGLFFSVLIHGLLLSVPVAKTEKVPEKRPLVRMARVVPPRPVQIPAPAPTPPPPPPPQEAKIPKESVPPKPEPEPQLKPEIEEEPPPEEAVEPPAPAEAIDTMEPSPFEQDIIEPETLSPPAEPPVVPSPLDQTWLSDLLLDRIDALKRYPYLARRNRWEGEVVVKAVIGGDGSLLGAEVIESSGYPVLDEDALSLVRQAMKRKLGIFETQKTPSDSETVLIPIIYRLSG